MTEGMIHKTAVIEAGAKIGKNVKIGAYAVIGKDVKIGDNTELKSHVVIDGDTEIGEGNIFFPFASIGQIPQDKKYQGEKTKLVIGNGNVIREYVTINPGTEGGGGITKIGDNCLFMANSHVAHDCNIGSSVIIANSVAVAGHVNIGDFVVIGGLSGIHQFVRIGKYAMIGGMSGVEKDVIPYGLVKGERAFLSGLNIVGLKRKGFSKEDINELRNAFDKVFIRDNTTFEQKIKMVGEEYKGNTVIDEFINFLMVEDAGAICQPK